MTESNYEYEYFYSRKGFNNAATHFDTVAEILGDFQQNINLADKLNLLLNDKVLVQAQLPALVSALLTDKFQYTSVSYNLEKNFQPEAGDTGLFADWKAVDVVLVYSHPDLGYTLLNPKNPRHWGAVSLFKSNELLTVYTGAFDKTKPGEKLYDLAAGKVLDFFNGKTPAGTETLKKGSFKFIVIDEEEKKAPAKKASAGRPKAKAASKTAASGAAGKKAAVQEVPAPKKEAPAEVSSKNRRMTPFYSVPVTNELFHNGNVEAWKKVIQSYQAKHKGLEVYIYYDGERIHDIHSLFKWGKVKHGSTILFAVAGEEIKDVAKLQRYLIQGASPRFEDFLKYPVNTVLNLF